MIQPDSATLGAMPPGGRERLKTKLREQRVALDLRYRNRELFLRERGVDPKGGLGRNIVAMENAERDNFDDVTFIAVENVYEWEHGSIAAVLAGREPRPKVPLSIPVAPGVELDRDEIHRLVDKLPLSLLARVRAAIDMLLRGEQ